MSNSQPSTSNQKFWILAGVILALSGAMVVSVYVQSGKVAAWEAQRLVVSAQQVSGAEAEADYRLANWLDASNPEAALHFAVIQTNLGRPEAALVILAKAGEGREVEVARIRAAIEAGQNVVATSAADKLLTLNPTQNDLVLVAVAYGVAGQPARAIALRPLVTAPEALQSVQRAGADKLALASVLATTGLQKSASGLLVKLPNSVTRSLLMGRILIDQNTEASLGAAVDYLSSGLVIDPANTVLRTELIKTLRTLKRGDEADKQQVLLDRLTAGRP